MTDYETDLFLILRAIEDIEGCNLTPKVTKVTIDVTRGNPGPLDKHINFNIQKAVKTVLAKSMFKLSEIDPLFPCTRIVVERRRGR